MIAPDVRPAAASAIAATLLAALAWHLPAPAAGAQRVLLVETFTNTGCAYCPAADAVTRGVLEVGGPDLMLGIQTHVNWPDPTDPFFVHDPGANAARRDYYGITTIPELRIDGAYTAPAGDYDAVLGLAADRLGQPSPLAIVVEQVRVGQTVTVTAGVKAEAAVPQGTLKLRMALVEREIELGTPPGASGETDFYWTLRTLLPDGDGIALEISQGDSVVVSRTTTTGDAWEYDQIRAVVWVQDDQTREVVQAGSSIPASEYTVWFDAPDRAAVVQMGELHRFDAVIHNLGTQDDRYDVLIERDVPGSWGASVCARGICYPPWVTDFTVDIAAGSQDSLQIDFVPLFDAGCGSLTLTVISWGDAAHAWTRTFKVITNDVPILCVDADGGRFYEFYYTSALEAAGRPFATWDRAREGPPSADLLRHFAIVVWNAGLAYPAISPADRNLLASYLGSGRGLLISGQDIGWSLCDPLGNGYSPEARSWYETYLGADYLHDDTDDLTLSGVAGDPVGDGLAFTLSASGVTAQDYPSEIQPREGATGCLLYSEDREAAVRYEHDGFKVVYLAFGFEGIVEPAQRDLLMERSLIWLGVDLVGVPATYGVPPRLVTLPLAAPNPFNPATTISFALEGTGTAPVEITLHDLRGRLVRRLWQGELAAGDHRLLWNGLTDSGRAAASGVYVARVRVGAQQHALKLTLAR